MGSYTKDCMVAVSVHSYLEQAWIHSSDCRAPHCGGSGEGMYRFGRGSQTPACRACTAASYHPYFLDGVHLQHRSETRERSGTSARCIEY
jgi:hypothetical protein